MGAFLIAFVGLQYLCIAAVLAWQRQWAQVIMYSGYSFAAVGGYMIATGAR